MIETQHLKQILAIARAGTLTEAAKSLYTTQSALSHAFARLEKQLGVAIWQKNGRQIVLTQAGRYLLQEAERLLPQIERLNDRLKQFASGQKGVLRIGMECYPCYKWLIKVVSPFLEQWPEVDIDIKQAFQFGGMAALFNREIDILVTPDPIQLKGLSFHPVFAYQQALMVSLSSELAAQDSVEPEELRRYTLFTYPIEKERLDIYSRFLFPANSRPKERKTIENTEMMVQLVAANRGVAALPDWLIKEYAKHYPVKAIALGKPGIAKQIHLGMRTKEKPEAYIAAFLQLAKHRVSSE